MRVWFFTLFVALQIRLVSGAPLHDAVADGDVAQVEALLQAGADVNAKTYNQFTALHLADTPQMVELLLRFHPRLDDVSAAGTPLQYATEKYSRRGDGERNWEAIVELLKQAGAEYDITSAIRLNDIDRVRSILAVDPKIALGGEETIAPLRVAAQHGRAEICKLLLANGADPNDVIRGNGYSILRDAVKHLEVVRALIAAGADVRQLNTWRGGRTGIWLIGDNATALHFAAGEGNPRTIELLIDSGVDLFARAQDVTEDVGAQTALEVAALYGRPENVAAILSHPKFEQGKVEERQIALDRSLIAAASTTRSCSEMVVRLLQSGADANVDIDGVNAVQLAAANVRPGKQAVNDDLKKAIAALVQHGATLDLCSAVAIGDQKRVEELLQASPLLADSIAPDGTPALHIATSMGDEQLVRRLLAAGCNVNIRNRSENKETALHCAAFWGRAQVAKLLLDAGADCNALVDGSSPLDEAIHWRNKDVAVVLFRQGGRLTGGDKAATEAELLQMFGEAAK